MQPVEFRPFIPNIKPKVDISLRQLIDIDTSADNIDRPDNIENNQLLVSKKVDDSNRVFQFKYLSSLIQAGTNITITDLDGIITINSSGGGSAVWGSIGTGTGVASQTDLISYLSSNYFPIPTGTTSQYVRGDGSLATFPSISGGIQHATASGTDTYTTTISGVTSYTDGDAYIIQFTNGNTTGCTLNINSLGAVTLYRNNDGVLIGGDIVANGEMICIYDATLPGFRAIGTAPNTLLSYVTNADSVTLTKGMAVYAFGGTGDRMTVKRAYNTGDATSAQTVGLVFSTSIAANQKGLIMMQGLLDGLSILPTSTYADGDAVYLGSTAGSITNVKQYAPNHLVYLGVVTTASPGSAGRMYVRVQNGYELDELHNVQAQSPTLKDTLWYDNTVSPPQWKTASIATILGYTPIALSNLSAVSPLSYNSVTGAFSIQQASGSQAGYLSSTDWTTFNNKVPSTRTITINGVTQDLSANRTFSVATVSAPFKSNTTIAHTATTSETTIYTAYIPAGTFAANDFLYYWMKLGQTPFNANTKDFRVYFNTSATHVGGTLVAYFQMNSSVMQYLPFNRRIIFQNSLSSQRILTYGTGTGTLSYMIEDAYNVSAPSLTTAINFAVDQYVVVSCKLAISTDTAYIHAIGSEIIR